MDAVTISLYKLELELSSEDCMRFFTILLTGCIGGPEMKGDEPTVGDSGAAQSDAEYEGDEAGECSDGADNDRDGDFDCDDEGCEGSPDCTDEPSSEPGNEPSNDPSSEPASEASSEPSSDPSSEPSIEDTAADSIFGCSSSGTETKTASDLHMILGSAYSNTAGTEQGSLLGWDMVMCDIDADGYDDLITTSPYYASNLGRARIFYGPGDSISMNTSASDFDVAIYALGPSIASGVLLGTKVSCGDIDGDGDKDLILSSGELASADMGLYVFENNGPSQRLTVDTHVMDADIIVTMDAGASSGSFWPQFWVADVDADNSEELLFFFNDNSNYNAENANNALTNGDNKIWALDLDGQSGSVSAAAVVGVRLNADGADAITDIQLLDDADGDGLADLFVGQGFLHDGSTQPGKLSYLSGYPLSNSTVGAIEAGGLEGSGAERFGQSVATGDFDGDGALEFFVGAPGADNGSGALYYYNRLPSSLNGSVAASILDDARFSGSTSNTYLGLGWEVMSVGDVDGDGADELLVSNYNRWSSPDGDVRLLSGACLTQPGVTLDDATMLKLTSSNGGSDFGNAIAHGDIDGDGMVDIAIGAFGLRDAVSSLSNPEGAVYLYLSSMH